jgi:hypothetical protein
MEDSERQFGVNAPIRDLGRKSSLDARAPDQLIMQQVSICNPQSLLSSSSS